MPNSSSYQASTRLASLDAYRGFIMIVLAFNGWNFRRTSENFPKSPWWQLWGQQFEHAEWAGCTFWDLILPSFMFMVGVSLPYSYARRAAMGDSYAPMLGHALRRSLVLILLGVFLFHMTNPPVSGLLNVLAQIGLGYWFVFLLWRRPAWMQATTAAAILAGTWALFFSYPEAGIDLQTGSPRQLWWTANPKGWAQHHLAGLAPQWHANGNFGHAFDGWLYKHVLLTDPTFRPGIGGYQIFGFVPEMALMIFGLMSGESLRSKQPSSRKAGILAVAGLAGLVLGGLLHLSGVCPMIKKIFTPSFALFSAGWCLLFLAGFYALIDLLHFRRWAFPLIVVGMNSIVMYCMYMLIRPWTAQALGTFLGKDIFERLGTAYAPTVEATAVGLVLWLICYWLYRQRIFVRI